MVSGDKRGLVLEKKEALSISGSFLKNTNIVSLDFAKGEVWFQRIFNNAKHPIVSKIQDTLPKMYLTTKSLDRVFLRNDPRSREYLGGQKGYNVADNIKENISNCIEVLDERSARDVRIHLPFGHFYGKGVVVTDAYTKSREFGKIFLVEDINYKDNYIEVRDDI